MQELASYTLPDSQAMMNSLLRASNNDSVMRRELFNYLAEYGGMTLSSRQIAALLLKASARYRKGTRAQNGCTCAYLTMTFLTVIVDNPITSAEVQRYLEELPGWHWPSMQELWPESFRNQTDSY